MKLGQGGDEDKQRRRRLPRGEGDGVTRTAVPLSSWEQLGAVGGSWAVGPSKSNCPGGLSGLCVCAKSKVQRGVYRLQYFLETR